MNWTEILNTIFRLCIIPLLSIATTCLIKWIDIKKTTALESVKNETAQKYINLLSETISVCVLSTKQTYVDALKEKDAFNAEAQKEAFALTFNAIMDTLSAEAKVYLAEIYGDLTTYITNKIEADVLYYKSN